jgi:ornithine decarboxylase
MSNVVAFTSPLDRFDEIQIAPVQEWDQKQLIAALENASLLDLQKVLKVHPIKAASSSAASPRRGRFMPVQEAVANIRLNLGEGERSMLEVNGVQISEVNVAEVMALVEMYAKVKVVEEVARQTGKPIEINMAPQNVKDQLMTLTSSGRSSFNLVNLGVVVEKYHLWRRCFPRIQPFYAVKSNPDEVICRTLHVAGAGFDCASKVELEQVLKLPGIDVNDIIFANPCKQVEHILFAKENNVSMMTFDNPFELDKIHKHYPESKLVLRLLPDDSHSLMPFGSKFGASFSESTALIAQCKSLGMSLIGVSFHVGSGCFSSIAWIEALKLARQVFDEAKKYGYHMNLVDMGGGFPGLETGNLPLSTIGPDVAPIADALFGSDVRIIAEPGRFFCTQSTTLACTVVSKRERLVAVPVITPTQDQSSVDSATPAATQTQLEPEFQLYLSDGIYGSMNCVVFDHAILDPIPLSSFEPADRPMQRTTMWGPTCDSIDVVVKGIPFPDTHVGEWIYFENMGAYTSAAASSFNGFAPPSPFYALNP